MRDCRVASGIGALLVGAGLIWGGDCHRITAEHEPIRFSRAPDGGFTFDTGVLEGKLRPEGRSLGLTEVVHKMTGVRLDRSNGLLSHYRVFTKGVRYGGGAWDWPSEARLRRDGAVQVDWAGAGEDRPFEMSAVYRWVDPVTIEVETIVRPERTLEGFEVFLASYFGDGFTNAAADVASSPEHSGRRGLLRARKGYGEWLMFPVNRESIPLIEDGRWKLEPDPVDWVIMPELARPRVVRRAPGAAVEAELSASGKECFAVAMPHETEGHYSVYFSLFGRDLSSGKTLRAKVRLAVGPGPDSLRWAELRPIMCGCRTEIF